MISMWSYHLVLEKKEGIICVIYFAEGGWEEAWGKTRSTAGSAISQWMNGRQHGAVGGGNRQHRPGDGR